MDVVIVTLYACHYAQLTYYIAVTLGSIISSILFQMLQSQYVLLDMTKAWDEMDNGLAEMTGPTGSTKSGLVYHLQ